MVTYSYNFTINSTNIHIHMALSKDSLVRTLIIKNVLSRRVAMCVTIYFHLGNTRFKPTDRVAHDGMGIKNDFISL